MSVEMLPCKTPGPSMVENLMMENNGNSDDMEISLKTLTRMAKRPEVDIEFQNLTYTVKSGHMGERKEILSGISGSFHTGQLTAILGPSGAGKSSLMNILVGYSSYGVTGNVNVNGKPRDLRLYRKLSCYIMQDDLMQECITVEEAMRVAAELKLGNELNANEKSLVIDEIINTIGLKSCRKVRTENLSGGQRKRLAVALELVNNPPVIFLDEPTSGLDIVSMKQCVHLLKHLAHCGRTIICTIHQPSASMFSLFDKVYILASGQCVYHGSPDLLVPFMSNNGLQCPVTYNPADFIMENLQMDQKNIAILANSIENGNISKYSESDQLRLDAQRKAKDRELELDLPEVIVKNMDMLPTSFCTQFIILLKRMMLQKRRNMTSLWIQVIHHLISGGLLGGIFYNIGNDGTLPISNFKYCISVLVFFMYTYVMIPILLYPTEFQLLKREYFNRWYGLKPYYAALMTANIPIMVTFGMILVWITYWLSGQIMELDRFLLFSFSCILTGYCSEGFGLAIGAIFNVRNGSIMGPSLVSPLLALSVYGLGFGPHIETFMLVLMRFSYLRYGLVALSVSLYHNRLPLSCSDIIYCHYADTRILLRDLGMQNANYIPEIIGLLTFTFLFRFATYLALRYRLQNEFSNKFLNYISRILRY